MNHSQHHGLELETSQQISIFEYVEYIHDDNFEGASNRLNIWQALFHCLENPEVFFSCKSSLFSVKLQLLYASSGT